MSREEETAEVRRHFPSRRADKNSVAEPSQMPDSANLDSYWEGESKATAPSRSAVTGRSARRKARRKKRTIAAVVILVVIGLITGAAVIAAKELGGISGIISGGEDYEGKGTGEVIIEIPEGASGKTIGRILEKEGVIADAEVFADIFKKNSLAQGVQAGRFRMHKRMSSREALAMLLDPTSKADIKVTIPPGFTVKQIKTRLEETAGFNADQVAEAFADPAEYGIPGQSEESFEGWLAPDTYTVSTKQSVKDLVKTMVDTQIKRLDEAGVAPEQRAGVLIKASILEKEVNLDRYYAQVARVIENRLQDNPDTHGFLQMDSTVVYGLGRSGGIPSSQDLKQDTPYNTYKHKGLPPTAIGTVGLKALQAAVKPADGKWLYFTTVNLDSGETKFALTLEEQKKNVEELKQWCQKNQGKCKR
ncbi:endolytic transglycosylase MltG [Varibaculum cambriense]|uniref:endolytic transglycosylase MltG n=1 Tax=Varibaculum cambriense TaxID=184870 RepID=UPI0039F4F8CD